MRATITTCPNCGHRNRVPVAGPGHPRCGNCHRDLPWMADAGDDDFGEVAENASLPVVVDLWATWCGPCRMVSPALEQLANEKAGQLKLVKVDVDRSPKTSARFDVQAVPTLLVIDHGEVIARQPGAVPLPALRRWVEDAITNRASGAMAGAE